jgi:hypothetical protein
VDAKVIKKFIAAIPDGKKIGKICKKNPSTCSPASALCHYGFGNESLIQMCGNYAFRALD